VTDLRMLTGDEFQTLGAENRKHEIQMLRCGGGPKLMRTGWAQRPSGFVILQEVGDIWRTTIM